MAAPDQLKLLGETWAAPAEFLGQTDEDGVRDMTVVRRCPDVHGHDRCPLLSTDVIY
jgi:hypothetical protein